MRASKSDIAERVLITGAAATALVFMETVFEGTLSDGGSSWTGLPLTDILHNGLVEDDLYVSAVYGFVGAHLTRAATMAVEGIRALRTRATGRSVRDRVGAITQAVQETVLGAGALGAVATMVATDTYMREQVGDSLMVGTALVPTVAVLAARPIAGYAAKHMAYHPALLYVKATDMLRTFAKGFSVRKRVGVPDEPGRAIYHD